MAKTAKNYPHKPEPKLRIISVDRTARSTKAGNRFSFRALVAVGDSCGRVGIGMGKSRQVANAIQKAVDLAAAQIEEVSLEAETIPHEVRGRYRGASVLLMPAAPGTGIIAGKVVRAVLECAGVKDAVGKLLGAPNPANVAKATLQALVSLRTRKHVYEQRGLKMKHAKAPLPLQFPDLDLGHSSLHLN